MCTHAQLSYYAARIQRLQALMSAGAPGTGAAQLQADVAHMEKQRALLRRAPWLINAIPLLTPRELDEHLRTEPAASAPVPAEPEPEPDEPDEPDEPAPHAGVTEAVCVPPIALHELLPLVMGASGAEAAAAALTQLREAHAHAPRDRLSVLAAEAWLDDLVPERGGSCDTKAAPACRTESEKPQAAVEPIVLPPLRYLSTS